MMGFVCSSYYTLILYNHLLLYNIDVENLNILLRLFLVCPHILDLVNDIKPLCGATENCVLSIQPGLSGVS